MLRDAGHEVVAGLARHRRQHDHRRGPGRGAGRAPRSSSTWRTRRRSRTPRCWSSSRPRPATCWPPETAAGVAITSRCPSSAPSGCPDSGYFRAKIAQEDADQERDVPYTIVRATQFYEFIGAHRRRGADGDTVRLPPALHPARSPPTTWPAPGRRRPVDAPVNGTSSSAGPEAVPPRRAHPPRSSPPTRAPSRPGVETDAHARYFGAELDDTSLTPGPNARIGTIHSSTGSASTDLHASQSRNAPQASQHHVIGRKAVVAPEQPRGFLWPRRPRPSRPGRAGGRRAPHPTRARNPTTPRPPRPWSTPISVRSAAPRAEVPPPPERSLRAARRGRNARCARAPRGGSPRCRRAAGSGPVRAADEVVGDPR